MVTQDELYLFMEDSTDVTLDTLGFFAIGPDRKAIYHGESAFVEVIASWNIFSKWS